MTISSSSSPPPPKEENQQQLQEEAVSPIPVAVAHYGATSAGMDPAAVDTNTVSTAATSSTNTGTLMPQSVVPDLMRVYESMTQSKTPQHPHAMAPPLAWPQPTLVLPSIPPPYPLPSTSAAAPRKRPPPPPPPTEGETTTAKLPKPKSRRKNNKSNSNDGRWTKRFTWPDALHQDFVAAIFDVGLQHASPSTVLEQMQEANSSSCCDQLTTERIKSHLQKYRLHRHKSKQEFLTAYAAAAAQYRTAGGLQGVTSVSGGNVAAHLTVTTTTTTTNEEEAPQPAVAAPPVEAAADVFTIPRLTEAEKASPIGNSLGYLLGLFHSLKQQLEVQRGQHQQQQQPPVAATTTSFAAAAPVPEEDPATAMDPQPVATTGSTASTGTHHRTNNLETSSRMQREMEHQIAFQNKMRALKQHELEKLADMTTTTDPVATKTTTTTEDEEFWNAAALDGDIFQFLMDP